MGKLKNLMFYEAKLEEAKIRRSKAEGKNEKWNAMKQLRYYEGKINNYKNKENK